MRGSLSLFTDIFEQPQVVVTTVKKKGRSSELHAKRNECLVHRYYYYCHFTDKRYSAVIETLSDEFFISIVTIPEVLAEHADKLRTLAKECPAKSYFTKKYPHLSW